MIHLIIAGLAAIAEVVEVAAVGAAVVGGLAGLAAIITVAILCLSEIINAIKNYKNNKNLNRNKLSATIKKLYKKGYYNVVVVDIKNSKKNYLDTIEIQSAEMKEDFYVGQTLQV